MADAKNISLVNNSIASQPSNKVRLLFSSRLGVTILCFLACVMTYVLRLSFGFAIVCMVHKPTIGNNTTNFTDSCFANGDTRSRSREAPESYKTEFDWDKSLQGLLLGGTFYGYIFSQIPAGWLSEKFGGKVVLSIGLGVTTVLQFTIPEVARISPYFLLVIRILQGAFSVTLPAVHSILGGWAPVKERTLLLALAYSGLHVGTIVTFPMCGFLCDHGFAGGWPSIFYVTGILGIAWFVGHLIFVYDNYEKHPRISPAEKLYLENELNEPGVRRKKVPIPWRRLFMSGPLWAISISHLSANWGLYLLAVNLPTYLDDVHKLKIKENGLLSAVPYVCTLIVTLITGKLSDILVKKTTLSTTTVRKIFNSIGMLVPAICMVILTLLNCNYRYYAIATITILQAFSSFAYAGGFFVNHVDIAPKLAGILMGISNMFAQIPGIVSPLLVGILTPDGTLAQWAIVFYIGMAAYIIGGISYLILGSSEEQPWAKDQTALDVQTLSHISENVDKQSSEMKNKNSTTL